MKKGGIPGAASLIAIAVLLSLTAFAAMCLATAKADEKTMDRILDAEKNWSIADVRARIILSELLEGKMPNGVTELQPDESCDMDAEADPVTALGMSMNDDDIDKNGQNYQYTGQDNTNVDENGQNYQYTNQSDTGIDENAKKYQYRVQTGDGRYIDVIVEIRSETDYNILSWATRKDSEWTPDDHLAVYQED